jgi:hypothetical protein
MSMHVKFFATAAALIVACSSSAATPTVPCTTAQSGSCTCAQNKAGDGKACDVATLAGVCCVSDADKSCTCTPKPKCFKSDTDECDCGTDYDSSPTFVTTCRPGGTADTQPAGSGVCCIATNDGHSCTCTTDTACKAGETKVDSCTASKANICADGQTSVTSCSDTSWVSKLPADNSKQ